MQGVDLGNDGLRPKRETESEEQGEDARDDGAGAIIGFAPAPRGHHPTQHARGEQGNKTHCQRTAQAAEKIHLPCGIADGQQLEKPGEERPERISGRMGHAEVLGRDNKLARVEQPDIGHGGVKINRAADQSGDAGSDPIGTREEGRTPGARNGLLGELVFGHRKRTGEQTLSRRARQAQAVRQQAIRSGRRAIFPRSRP